VNLNLGAAPQRHSGEIESTGEKGDSLSCDPAAPIGIFDSGLGGLTVVREVIRLSPQSSILYLADTAHVPYGPRPPHEIRAFARGIIHALISRGARSVIAACNISSAVALPYFGEEFRIPVVGMIEAGVAAALEDLKEEPLGILATEGTCKSGAYPAEARKRAPELAVEQSPCPDFVPLVEAGRTDGPEVRDAARRYLRPLLEAGCRTIILGCTHYPWLLPVLQEVAGPEVKFSDPAQAAAKTLLRRLSAPSAVSSPPVRRFAATAHPDRLEAGAARWLGLEAKAEYWPIWEEKPAAFSYEEMRFPIGA
jgi:glutamate racemase